MNAPICPKCGKDLVKRTRKSDGKSFLGCSGYPECKHAEDINENCNSEHGVNISSMLDRARGKEKKPVFTPSPYQQAIFDWVKSDAKSLVVKALAGSGKTTTGVKMLSFVDSDLSTIYLAFNKHIAEELKTRVTPNVTVMTYHALGYSGVRAAFPRTRIDDDKVSKIIENYLEKYTYRHLYSAIKKIVALVKNNLTDTSPETLSSICERYGIELNGDSALVFQVVPNVVEQCKIRTDTIDFDDMCWLPVVLNLPVKKFDFLFVDEAQDTNKCQIALALMAMKETSRIVAVGDEYQSIYGFRGADVDAIPNLIENLDADTLPLSITYRCPKKHVELVNKLFPEIGLECSETAMDGIIRNISKNAFYEEVLPNDMILCRLNAPLVEPVFALIRKGVKAIIRGREIGSGLITLIRRMKAADINELISKLSDYARREVEKLQIQEKNAQAQALQDKIDTINALCDGVYSITELEEKIETIFSDDNAGIIFSSIHKAKGLEAKKVYILGNELMPSKMAKSDWEKQQERNIQYVAYTRSLNELIFIQ